MRELTVLEQIILASIIHLGDEAYGLAIRKKAKALSGKSLMYGALYNAPGSIDSERIRHSSHSELAWPAWSWPAWLCPSSTTFRVKS